MVVVHRDQAQIYLSEQRTVEEATDITTDVPGQHKQGDDVRIAYVTDHEHKAGQLSPNVLEMTSQVDVLIHDAQYTREQVASTKKGWGHSGWEDVLELAVQSQVKRLFLFHHDPDTTDAELNERQLLAQQTFPHIIMAREGLKVPLIRQIKQSKENRFFCHRLLHLWDTPLSLCAKNRRRLFSSLFLLSELLLKYNHFSFFLNWLGSSFLLSLSASLWHEACAVTGRRSRSSVGGLTTTPWRNTKHANTSNRGAPCPLRILFIYVSTKRPLRP